ncbi:LytR C-terminal domain-containing protein [Streptacidiphilus rugosus]|uniref:LytR C-terminal domain-containing protein n=1 Tax=Streptacidiphilus rugosus TaxID=405783 RepID=UPI00068B4B11|nr:LytR C-terminal domain-containing protein [Streptacidiphilus rugosus]
MGTRGKSRRRAQGSHSGPWLAGAAGFLALSGVGGFLLLHGGGSPTASAHDALTPSPTASSSAAASASAAPDCTARPADAAFAAAGPKAKPINVRVTVLNGSGTFGQAETVLSWMQNTEKYLRTSNGGPAAHRQATTTLVYAPDHVDQARALVAALGLPVSALHGDGTARGARDPMVLTLGSDFHGVGKTFSVC